MAGRRSDRVHPLPKRPHTAEAVWLGLFCAGQGVTGVWVVALGLAVTAAVVSGRVTSRADVTMGTTEQLPQTPRPSRRWPPRQPRSPGSVPCQAGRPAGARHGYVRFACTSYRGRWSVSRTGPGGKTGEVRYAGPSAAERAADRLRHVGNEDAVRSHDGLRSTPADKPRTYARKPGEAEGRDPWIRGLRCNGLVRASSMRFAGPGWMTRLLTPHRRCLTPWIPRTSFRSANGTTCRRRR
jgi:hypothetical protein